MVALGVSSLLISRNAAGGEPMVSFSADRADVDLDARRADLVGHVIVQAARATLRAPRLRLEYLGDDEVRVRGPVDLFWCEVPDRPPLSLRVGEATVGRDTVSARDVRLRAFGTTVGYLPWIALRGPSRWGLLPPALSLRATDGPLVSAGLHVPLSRAVAVDVRPGAYVRGGTEIRSALLVPGGGFTSRWDRRATALLSVKGQAGVADVAAVDIDILRGGRARAGTTELGDVTRPYDRGSAGAQSLGPVLSAGAGLRFAGPRISGPLVLAPRMVVTVGAPLGPFVSSGALEMGTFFDARGDARPVIRLDRDATTVGFVGPTRLRATLRGAALAEGTQALRSHGFAVLALDAGVPLTRSFGEARHVVDPGLSVSTSAATGSSSLPNGIAPELQRGAAAIPAARVATSLRVGDVRLASRLAAGALLQSATASPVYRGGAVVDSPRGAVRIDAYGTGQGSAVLSVLVDVGEEQSASAFGLLSSRHGEDSVVSRGLGSELPSTWTTGSLARAGTSQSAGLRVPFGEGYAVATAFDGDLDESVVIGASAAVGYVHPCGCLAASATSSTRIGRPGVDTMFLLDLAPTPGSKPLPRPRWN